MHVDLQWNSLSLEHAATSWLLPRWALGLFRLLAFGVIAALNLSLFCDKKGGVFNVETRSGALKQVTLDGLKRFATYTTWCWTLQGVYFFIAAACSFADEFPAPLNALNELVRTIGFAADTRRPLTRVLWVLFEVSFTMAFLVSSLGAFARVHSVSLSRSLAHSLILLLSLVPSHLCAHSSLDSGQAPADGLFHRRGRPHAQRQCPVHGN